MDSEISLLALKALDGLSLRSEVTAHNIANGNTPGYRPLRVSFEEALRLSAARGPAAVAAAKPAIHPAELRYGETEMRLDLELASAASTAGRYAAIVEVLNRAMQMNLLSIRGSR